MARRCATTHSWAFVLCIDASTCCVFTERRGADGSSFLRGRPSIDPVIFFNLQLTPSSGERPVLRPVGLMVSFDHADAPIAFHVGGSNLREVIDSLEPELAHQFVFGYQLLRHVAS